VSITRDVWGRPWLLPKNSSPPSASNLTADEATFLYTIITPRRRRVKLQFTVEKVGVYPTP